MQEHTADTSELVNVPLTGADKVAYAFYATAATAALVGQVWAGVTHIPWPEEGFPIWLQIAVVTPAVAVIELGGVATAALADLRRRKGEQAYAYRAMSLFAALVALVFNVVGHWRPEERFLAFGFGGLSAFAYVLWLIHSSARRRDALRRAGQMANTGPVYGLVQWAREPKVTWLARSLALEHGYGLYESLRQAREQLRTTARRVAIAGTVAEFIRSEQQDERLAKIAETTYDPDKLAAMLEERVNYETVTARLTRAIAPAPDTHQEQERSDLRAAVWVVEDAAPAPEVAAGGGVPLRGANDRWSEAIGELTAAEYLPYDRSSDEPDVIGEVVDEEEPDRRQQRSEVAEAPRTVVSPAEARPAASAAQPAAEPARQAAAQRVTQPAQPAAMPAPPAPVKRTSKPAAKPATKTAARSTTKPAKPAAQRTTRTSEPTMAARTQPVAESTIPPAAEPARPVVEPTTPPTVVVATPAPAPARSVEPEEPVVVARKVASRTRPATTSATTSAAESAGAQERDSEKKKMRAWALLSDWPSDRKRDASTLASAIAASETYAAQLIKQYDEEHGNRTLVGTQHQQS